MELYLRGLIIFGYVMLLVFIIMIITIFQNSRNRVCIQFNKEAAVYVEECSKYSDRRGFCESKAYSKFCSEKGSK